MFLFIPIWIMMFTNAAVATNLGFKRVTFSNVADFWMLDKAG